MKINNISLPYPVLGNSDDIEQGLPDVNIEVDVSQDSEFFYFTVKLHQDNEDITKLIEEGKAEYTCEITCARTYLRKCFSSSEPEIKFELNRLDVFGRIDFSCYVTVCDDIPDYHNQSQNSDYGDSSFHLDAGDILCAFDTASWNASLVYEKLFSAGSFMVVLNGGEKNTTWFDANGDRIKVYLPEDMFDQFRLLCNDNSFNEMFHASIVFNALFKVLSEYDEKQYGQLQWAEAIKYRIDREADLHDFNITDTSEAYELAQALLKDPYRRLFNHLKQEQENR